MGHDHGHGHDGPHRHGPRSMGSAFAIGIALNVGFVAVEIVFGALSGSVALLADAGHNASDVLGLVLAWLAFALAKRPPTRRRTYGLRSSTILASLTNAALLLIAVGAVVWEAIQRLTRPTEPAGVTMIAVAGAGVVVNAVSAMLFLRGSKEDANIRGAFLHLAADAGVSLGVVFAAAILLKTGWTWIDPVASLLVSAAVLAGTLSLLRQSLDLALQAVPRGIDPDAVRSYLGALPGVREVHDLHIWPMSTTETALTAHLVMPEGECGACAPRFLRDVGEALHERFGIEHSTIQVEPVAAESPCELAPEDRL